MNKNVELNGFSAVAEEEMKDVNGGLAITFSCGVAIVAAGFFVGYQIGKAISGR